MTSPSHHYRSGWAALLVFATLGLALEALHAFKVGWYLDVVSETRRSMFTLGHAHGTLLGLVQIAFATTVDRFSDRVFPSAAGRLLDAATILLPGGFLLGGIWVHGGDPSVGVLLVPFGALALIASAAITLWSLSTSK
jgi:hypothetical protein